jgi:hypothetical protein
MRQLTLTATPFLNPHQYHCDLTSHHINNWTLLAVSRYHTEEKKGVVPLQSASLYTLLLSITAYRNCLLKQVIKGKIKGEMEMTSRHKKLLDDIKDRRGYSHLKEEALDRTMWRNRFGRGFGPVVRILNE